MPQWIWKHKEWPNFTWDVAEIQPLLSKARLVQGKLLGVMKSFSHESREELNLKVLTEEMLTTSAIEGSIIDRDSVRSSIYHRLGIEHAGTRATPDRYVEGLLDVMLDATENHEHALTLDRLCRWQAALFPTGYSGIQKIIVGQLRGAGEMKIISGRGKRQSVHYLAPPHEQLENDIQEFLNWFNHASRKKDHTDGIIRAAIAHIWFERIHPFDDGNGRVSRAIIDMALAQDEDLPTRFYSISSAIMSDRKGYYHVLDNVTKGDLNVTVWVKWFLHCFMNAIESTFSNIELALKKSQFWQHHADTSLNERQKKVLNKMLEKGEGNFDGGMTTRKYGHMTKVSRATAYRELADLVSKKSLKSLDKKGRSAGYEILWPDSR